MLKKIVFLFPKDVVIKTLTLSIPFIINNNTIADLAVGNFFIHKRGVRNV